MIDTIKNNELFTNIREQDIPALLQCLGGRERSFSKGDFILLAGRSGPRVGVLLSGRAQIVKQNFFGDSMIISSLKTGDMFGETYACMNLKAMPVSVVALEKCSVLFLDVARIVHTCKSACPFHQQLIANLLRITAEKNAILSQKMSYLTHKTIRGRLEAYFQDQARRGGSCEFSIPYNRSELAEYLCIDRSAMSRELSHMKADGLLDYSGRRFRLHR